MVRALVTLLLLAVFFLSGMILGMDNGQQTEQDKTDEEQVETTENTDPDVEVIEVTNDTEMDMGADSDKFSQTSASFLGDIIHGFYELVVTVFYQFAQLFF